MNDTIINIENQINDIASDDDKAKEIVRKDTLKLDIEANAAEYTENNDKNEDTTLNDVKIVNIDEGKNNDRNIGKGNLTGFYGGNNQVTWVQFFQGGGMMGGGHIPPPPGGAPLNYNPRTRNQFVMLVFVIVFIMLLCTAVFNIIVFTNPSLKLFFLRMGFMIAIPALILMVCLNYAIACSACARYPPCNIVCLVLAVVGMSLICAFITVRYETRIVLYAMLATLAVVFVCILLACSSFDFTQWMLYVIVISVAFCALAMIVSLTMVLTGTYMPMVRLIILLVGTLINVVILTIELQTILGGRAVELGEEEYALGAFLLYTSILDLFLKMVQILGIFDDM